MASEAWCSSFSLYWSADFSFYDRRSAVLQVLADEGALREWRMQDHVVGARLALNHELLVRCDSLSIARFDGVLDSHVLTHALSAVAPLEPRVEAATLSVQHLEELPGEYDEQASLATRALLGELAASVSADDFSLLLSGRAGDATDYRAELGVVSPDEAEARLSRSLGQLAELEAPHTAPAHLPPRDFPEVALYVDSRWHTHAVGAVEGSGVEVFIGGALREAGVLVDSVLARIRGDRGNASLTIGATR